MIYDKNLIKIENCSDEQVVPIKDFVWFNVYADVVNKLDRFGMIFWVSAGTALGFYRDKKVISEDTDLDFEIMMTKNSEDYESILIKEFSKNYDVFRKMWYDKNIMQLCFKHKNTGILVDLYFFYDFENNDFLINFNEHGMYRFPKKFIPKCFKGLEEFLPDFTKEYLVWRYGENWKIPISKKDWCDQCGSALRKW